MTEHTAEKDAPRIARVDRYTITVGGHTIRADERQEQAIRSMTAQQRADFLTIMGRDARERMRP